MTTIRVRGASEHNLEGFDVDLPRDALVVVTGVSGSGKSSLAFDTICREAQRRYLESFSSYARQFLGRAARPAVRSISGLSPAIAVDQKSVLRNPRSTVGTLTGLHDDLRLLYARLGDAPPGLVLDRRLFSFNSPVGACPACKGLGLEDRLDPDLLVADPARTIRQGALVITTPTGYVIYSQVTIDVLDQVCRAHGFDVDTPWRDLSEEARAVVLNGSDIIRIPYGKHPLASRMRWSGITAKPREEGVYKGILPVMEQILRRSRNRNILRFVRSLPCRACGGARLGPHALSVRFRGSNIAQVSAFAVDQLSSFLETVSFSRAEAPVGDPIRAQMLARSRLLERLGLGHLSLDRVSTSLSGGESQRIRLASQVSAELQGVLYVFDEPSIGLHATEQSRLLDVLEDLRDGGNTVLVVEHDDETMRRADWLVDIGPGAGEHGGELLFSGPPSDLASADARSATRAHLVGDARAPLRPRRRQGSGPLRMDDVSRNNLAHFDVEFLRGALNVVTGVSGAGKSSLVQELVDRIERGVLDERTVGKVIHVDQSPIGRTPRSNPATYTGLSDAIRDLFAAQPAAVAAGFGKSRFSFNVPGGRCEACQGAGVQQIGMHFLGQVAVVCDACSGRRFNEETLAITCDGRSIAGVLEMTIEEASGLLGGRSEKAGRILDVLRQLGLGYLRLGQASTTLSGGEAQRLKLAAELSRPGRGHTLYVLDEPTTGLHAADVVVLLAALSRLADRGHTLVVIEHHLDVVRAADRVIDLGPGSGRQGGRLVACGTPEEVAACEASRTGAALRGSRVGRASGPSVPPASRLSARPHYPPLAPPVSHPCSFTGVSTHNLKKIDVLFPANRLTVVTGVSGSGKSSLAFDTLYAEGRNRFTESFSAYARRFLEKSGDAEFEQVSGLRPAVAIRQRVASRNPRSTLGTMTEIADYYRLMFSRIGSDPASMEARGTGNASTEACATGNASTEACATGSRPSSSFFSPNSEQGACPACKGLGAVIECDPEKLITHPGRSLLAGAMDGHKTGRFHGDPNGQHVATLRAAARDEGVDLSAPWNELGDRARDLALRGNGGKVLDVEWHYRRGSRSGVHRFRGAWPGLIALVGQEYERKHADRRGAALEPLMHSVTCPACRGARLRPEALAITVAGMSIAALMALSVGESIAFFERLHGPVGQASRLPGAEPSRLPGAQPSRLPGEAASRLPGAHASRPPVAARSSVLEDIRDDVLARLRSLRDAGLEYLSLDRPAATLSAGEAQRATLATGIATGLTGITYVLDEPTAGLHARDTARLLDLLRALRDAGNTVVVVEHDEEVIRAADHVIDLGPGAGEEGGRIVAAGPPALLSASSESLTGRYLAEGERRASGITTTTEGPRRLRPGIAVRGATCHNLRGVDVDIPVGGLVVFTGVSGSGKSTLVFDVVAPALARHLPRSLEDAVVTPLETFGRVVAADRNVVASVPSSTPATILGLSDPIRDLFASGGDARARGLGKRHFSTNVKGGRCETCQGAGRIRVSMDFLPDVWVPCDDCGGSRFRPEVLACRIGGRSIADILAMTIAEAALFFESASGIGALLSVPLELGLGYLRLGQGADTLSGGERQRLTLASELLHDAGGPTLFLFDEPTTGLHFADVERLLQLFDRLVVAGHTLLVVEHNLDVVRAADWVIDLGPEGGDGGGRVVASGPPDRVARAGTWTGRALAGSGRSS